MKLKEFVAEIKTDLRSYDNAGLIDEISVRRWVTNRLKLFGNNIMTTHEFTGGVLNGTVELPENFWHLKLALKVEPGGYEFIEGTRDDLQDEFFWTEKTERIAYWDELTASYINEDTNVIIEKLYLNKTVVDFHYVKPQLLSVIDNFSRKFCTSDCQNVSPVITNGLAHQITLNERTVNTNFTTGYVYFQYKGLAVDEDGDIIIPETQHNHLMDYLEYYAKRRIMEDVVFNNGDATAVKMLTYVERKERENYTLAAAEAKMRGITPTTFRTIRNNNRRQSLKFEVMVPNK